MKRKSFYYLVSIVMFIGYAYLALHLNVLDFNSRLNLDHKENSFCLIKNITTVPCPSCGTTRAVVKITNFEFFEAFWLNPFGYIVISLMIILPIWLLFDFLTKSSSLFIFYNNFNKHANRKIPLISMFIIIILNWMWNIYKGI